MSKSDAQHSSAATQELRKLARATMPQQMIVAALLGAAIAGLIWVATTWFSPLPVVRGAAVIHPERGGEFKVHYTVQDTPNSSSGGTLENITAIELHPHYVVVRQRDGSGRVFFRDRTRDLSWSP
jgi:hypothetical protein